MKNKFIYLFLFCLICNFAASAMVQTVYTIQNPEKYAGIDDVYWVPVPGDSVLVKVTDKSKSAAPAIIQQAGDKLVPNFVYIEPGQRAPQLSSGLFCFQNDKGLKENGEYVVRDFTQPTYTFIWSSRDKCYCGHTPNPDPKKGWHSPYAPAGKDPNPFKFHVKNETTKKDEELTIPSSSANELKNSLNKLAGNLKTLKTKLESLSAKLKLLKGGLEKKTPDIVKITPAPKVEPEPEPKKELTVVQAVDKIFGEARKLVGDVPNASVILADNPNIKDIFTKDIQSVKHFDFRDGIELIGDRCRNAWLKLFRENALKTNPAEKVVDDLIEESIKYFTGEPGSNFLNQFHPNLLVHLDPESKKGVIKVAKNALANEIKYLDHYVFYHAHAGEYLAILYEIYQYLYAWGMLHQNQPLVVRFLDEDAINEKDETKIEDAFSSFRNKIKLVHCKAEQNVSPKKCQYPYEPGKTFKLEEIEYGQSVDLVPTFKKRLLSVNLALFGNQTKVVESTFRYFMIGKSAEPITVDLINSIVKEISTKLQIKDFEEKINQIIRTHEKELDKLSPQQKGVLLQIFIKKGKENEKDKEKIVDQVAYWALDGGYNVGDCPSSDAETCEDFNSFKTKISNLLDMYLNDPIKLNLRVMGYNHAAHFDSYNINLDTLQARIWLASPYVYNPNTTKIFRYSLDNKVFDDLHKELAVVFAELIKEFIKQKVQDEKDVRDKKVNAKRIDPAKLPKAFQTLNKFIDDQLNTIKVVKNEASWLPAFMQVQTV